MRYKRGRGTLVRIEGRVRRNMNIGEFEQRAVAWIRFDLSHIERGAFNSPIYSTQLFTLE
jgi:hypothetical protein